MARWRATPCSASSIKDVIRRELSENPDFRKVWNATPQEPTRIPPLLRMEIKMNRWVLHPAIEKVTRESTLLELESLPVFGMQDQQPSLSEWNQNQRK
jgi:hypothetical protein